jgi:hypothetical protein
VAELSRQPGRLEDMFLELTRSAGSRDARPAAAAPAQPSAGEAA